MNKKCGIYRIKCRSTGKLYIGSSVNIYVRWTEHRRLLRLGKSPCLRLQRAWNKYGSGAFRFAVLEECKPRALLTREQHYVDRLKPAFECSHQCSVAY